MNISNQDVSNRYPLTALESTPPVTLQPQPCDVMAGHLTGDGPITDAGSPTSVLREATSPGKPGWAALNAEVEARLAEDPDYQAAQAAVREAEQLATDMSEVDGATLFFTRDNGEITLEQVRAVANDACQTDAARSAAQRLLANMALWNEVSRGDNKLTAEEVSAFLRERRAAVSAMKAECRAEAKAEGATAGQAHPAAAPGPAATATGSAEVAAQLNASSPRPAPSPFTGLEGAAENLNSLIGWSEGEIDRLTALMAKTSDPAQLKQLETQINQMTRRMQQMAALLNQVMSTMQNISKMYSDITMNAVRNMR